MQMLGFDPKYCNICDPEVPKPPPIEIVMTKCRKHKALSVDASIGTCSLCEHLKRLKRMRHAGTAL